MSDQYQGPHSPFAWLVFAVFCLILVLVEHSFLGLLIGIAITVTIGFVAFKMVGGDGGLFR